MVNLIAGWLLMAALYYVYMSGYPTPDPARAARFDYRQKVGDRYGLLPPSREPVGVVLWIVTVLGFVGSLGFFLVGDRFVGTSSGAMIGAFLITLWRDDKWIKQQPDYQAAIKALKATAARRSRTDDPDPDSDAPDSAALDSARPRQ